jgi:hypothetical protein
MTTEKFIDYLQHLQLDQFIKDWPVETSLGMEVRLNAGCEPMIQNFTQVSQMQDKTWFVRLGKEDYYNDDITNGFFNETTDDPQQWDDPIYQS